MLFRSLECQPNPPPGRTLVEFAAAAWTPFHSRYFRDNSVPGHHREPGWLAFAVSLETILKDYSSEPLGALTDRIYSTLVESLLEADLKTQRETWEKPCPFGAFRYDAHGDHIDLHFHNAFMPDSPFRHHAELVEGLRGIIDDAAGRSLSIRTISCDSWINYLAPFQTLFPPSFIASIQPTTPDNKGGNGWWGQFIDKTGRFNEKRAQTLRDTRQFEILRAHAECLYSDFVSHVRSLKP